MEPLAAQSLSKLHEPTRRIPPSAHPAPSRRARRDQAQLTAAQIGRRSTMTQGLKLEPLAVCPFQSSFGPPPWTPSLRLAPSEDPRYRPKVLFLERLNGSPARDEDGDAYDIVLWRRKQCLPEAPSRGRATRSRQRANQAPWPLAGSKGGGDHSHAEPALALAVAVLVVADGDPHAGNRGIGRPADSRVAEIRQRQESPASVAAGRRCGQPAGLET